MFTPDSTNLSEIVAPSDSVCDVGTTMLEQESTPFKQQCNPNKEKIVNNGLLKVTNDESKIDKDDSKNLKDFRFDQQSTNPMQPLMLQRLESYFGIPAGKMSKSFFNMTMMFVYHKSEIGKL